MSEKVCRLTIEVVAEANRGSQQVSDLYASLVRLIKKSLEAQEFYPASHKKRAVLRSRQDSLPALSESEWEKMASSPILQPGWDVREKVLAILAESVYSLLPADIVRLVVRDIAVTDILLALHGEGKTTIDPADGGIRLKR